MGLSPEERYKIPANTKFAVVGRELADAWERNNYEDIERHVRTLALARAEEYEQRDHAEVIAALARQVGDAALQKRDVRPLVEQIVEAMKQEQRGGTVVDLEAIERTVTAALGRRLRR